MWILYLGQDIGSQPSNDQGGLQLVSYYLDCGLSVLIDEIRLAQSVKDAIADGVHPKMISKGSSGSYFARAKVDGKVQTVAYVIYLTWYS